MAKIKSEIDDSGKLHIHFKGPIDATTVPEFDAFISDRIDEYDAIVLDLKDVPYISSAGLRVILKTDLAMKEKDGFFIDNINDEVYEIFRMVNFHRFLNIYGKEEDHKNSADEEKSDCQGEYFIEDTELSEEVKNLLPPSLNAYLNIKTVSFHKIIDASDNTLVWLIDELKDESVRGGMVFNDNTKADFYSVLSVVDEYYKEKNVNKISLSIFGEPEKGYDRILRENGFEDFKQFFQIHTKKEDLLSSPFYKKAEKLSGELSRVKTYNELSDAQKMVLTFNFGIENGDSLDPVFSNFFTIGDDVKGVLLAREISDNVLVVYNINAMADKDARLAVPLMLASFLKICENFLGKNATLLFVCHTENQCKSLLKALEVKDNYDVLGEYTKDLNSYWE